MVQGRDARAERGIRWAVMGSALPDLERAEFERRLVSAAPGVPLEEATLRALHTHYQELRRWNRRLSLIGPGQIGAVVERHYAESLCGLELIPDGRQSLLDLGSGAGFPGFVLAAARPDLEVFLVEARQRKWAFLEAVRRRAGLHDGEPARVDHYPHSPKFPSLRAILRFTPFG